MGIGKILDCFKKKNAAKFFILTLIWMGFIFYMSSKQGDDSAGLSDSVVSFVIYVFNFLFGKNPPGVILDIILEGILIRKLAHFIEYFILGILVFLTWYSMGLGHRIILPFVFCVVYAASDELHQLFVPGRHGSITDVIIDSAGSGAAILLARLIKQRDRLKKKS